MSRPISKLQKELERNPISKFGASVHLDVSVEQQQVLHLDKRIFNDIDEDDGATSMLLFGGRQHGLKRTVRPIGYGTTDKIGLLYIDLTISGVSTTNFQPTFRHEGLYFSD